MPQACPMQITASGRGFLAAALFAVVATVLAVTGPTGPAAASSSAVAGGRIGPGTQMITAGRSCTANFAFRDARHRLFVGYAASCAVRRVATNGNACTARPLPLGTRVAFAERGRTLGHGTLRYSSLRNLRRAGVTDPATCAANDFALVRVRGAVARKVDPTVPHWGGPAGIGELPAKDAIVFGLLRPSARQRALPRVGTVAVLGTGSAVITTPLPSTRAARGTGFLDDAGRAVGILTASRSNGSNTVVSLAAVVEFARLHGFAGLRVVRGHEPFATSAVV